MLPITPSSEKKPVVTGSRGKSAAEWDKIFAPFLKAYLDDKTSIPSESLNKFTAQLKSLYQLHVLTDLDRYSLINFLTTIIDSIRDKMADAPTKKLMAYNELIAQLNELNKKLEEKLRSGPSKPSTSAQSNGITLTTAKFFTASSDESADKALFAIQYMIAELANGIAEELQVPKPTPATAEIEETAEIGEIAELKYISTTLKGEYPQFYSEVSEAGPSYTQPRPNYVDRATSPILQIANYSRRTTSTSYSAGVGQYENFPETPREGEVSESQPLLGQSPSEEFNLIAAQFKQHLDRILTDRNIPSEIKKSIISILKNLNYYLEHPDRYRALLANQAWDDALALLLLAMCGTGTIMTALTANKETALSMLCSQGNPNSSNVSCRFLAITTNTQNIFADTRWANEVLQLFLYYAGTRWMENTWMPWLIAGSITLAKVSIIVHRWHNYPPLERIPNQNFWKNRAQELQKAFEVFFSDPITGSISLEKTATNIVYLAWMYFWSRGFEFNPFSFRNLDSSSDNALICDSQQPPISIAATGCVAAQLTDQVQAATANIASNGLFMLWTTFGISVLLFFLFAYRLYKYRELKNNIEQLITINPSHRVYGATSALTELSINQEEQPQNHSTPPTRPVSHGDSFSIDGNPHARAQLLAEDSYQTPNREIWRAAMASSETEQTTPQADAHAADLARPSAILVGSHSPLMSQPATPHQPLEEASIPGPSSVPEPGSAHLSEAHSPSSETSPTRSSKNNANHSGLSPFPDDSSTVQESTALLSTNQHSMFNKGKKKQNKHKHKKPASTSQSSQPVIPRP